MRHRCRPASRVTYREWRGHPTSACTYLCARRTELGQVFDLSLLKSEWNREQFRRVISRSIDDGVPPETTVWLAPQSLG